MLEPERRASAGDVALLLEVCSHSHPRSLLTVFVAVAIVGSGGCYFVNDVAFSSEVCFHLRSPLAVFVSVCRGFWGLLFIAKTFCSYTSPLVLVIVTNWHFHVLFTFILLH